MAQTNAFKKPGTNHAESWTHHECAPLTHIEYNIYSYSNDDNPRACWQKCGSADQPELAINHAEELYNSGQFSKVEVKQKYYDLRTQRNIDETWRVFEKGGRRTSPSTLIIGFAVTSAIIAFAWTYLMAV